MNTDLWVLYQDVALASLRSTHTMAFVNDWLAGDA